MRYNVSRLRVIFTLKKFLTAIQFKVGQVITTTPEAKAVPERDRRYGGNTTPLCRHVYHR